MTLTYHYTYASITKVYVGACEYITKNGQTTTHTYLSGTEGLFAIMVKEPNGTQYIRYIHTDHLGSWNTIDFADNGHGIKPDLMDKIFMPFFTSKKEGSGIELSLSRQIMQMHKGAISFKSRQDEGTVFTLAF